MTVMTNFPEPRLIRRWILSSSSPRWRWTMDCHSSSILRLDVRWRARHSLLHALPQLALFCRLSKPFCWRPAILTAVSCSRFYRRAVLLVLGILLSGRVLSSLFVSLLLHAFSRCGHSPAMTISTRSLVHSSSLDDRLLLLLPSSQGDLLLTNESW